MTDCEGCQRIELMKQKAQAKHGEASKEVNAIEAAHRLHRDRYHLDERRDATEQGQSSNG